MALRFGSAYDLEVGVETNFSPRPGAQPFGKYYLLDRIGAGGMAEVFLAVVTGLEGFQRTVVIKRMLPHLSHDRSFVQMFIDEAKLCGLLSHPNLVQIFEFGKIDDSFFIAMEHVNGQPLSAVLSTLAEAGRQAPVAASLDIARQVCLGLHYAHSLQSATGQPLGIVHRDISPSNLMVSFHGGVKILDFGIAHVAEGLRETQTQVGTMKGKVSYMSPEQIRMERIDNRCDIFSLGIVLHEMLTGHRLFRMTNEQTAARTVLESVVPLPSAVNSEVPTGVDRVVMRALERNPDARYQTAGEMGDDLEQELVAMRASPQQTQKLLGALFPHGPGSGSEVLTSLTPSLRAPGSSGSGLTLAARTPSRSGGSPGKVTVPDLALEVDVGSLGSSRGRGAGRGSIPALALVAVAVTAAAVLALRTGRVPLFHPTAADAVPVAQAAALPIAPQPPAEKAFVRVSLDSSPQDAEVIREDSGEAVGRTPLTISLPRASDVIVFRFQTPGHTPASYKVIPDLDKAVRVDLLAEQTPAGPARRPTPVRPQSASRPGRPGATTEAASTAEPPRDCSLSVASYPWTELWIDGKDTGQHTPVVHFPVACGPHKLGLRRRDIKLDRAEPVTLTPGHELKQYYELGDDYGQ